MDPLSELTIPDGAASSNADLDGDGFLMLEESFRAADGGGVDDDEMDLDLLTLEPEPLPERAASSSLAAVAAPWHHSAPCIMQQQDQDRLSSFAVTPPPTVPSESDLLRRLAVSMKRSDETRARLLEHEHGHNTDANKRARASRMSPPSALLSGRDQDQDDSRERARRQHRLGGKMFPPSQSCSLLPSARKYVRPPQAASAMTAGRLSGFLSGDLKTLTSGLEQSRMMVQRHGSMVIRSAHGGVGL